MNTGDEHDLTIVDVFSNWSAWCRIGGISELLLIVYLLVMMVQMVVRSG